MKALKKYITLLLPVILIIVMMAMPSCKAKYSFNTREGKKKLSYYNTIPYKGYPVKPRKLNKIPK